MKTTIVSKKCNMGLILAVALIALGIILVSSTVALAADVTSTGTESVEAVVPLTGTINALTVSVTHPASIEYTIDPNIGYEGGAFIAPDIAITNNTVAPINVTVKSLASAAGGTLQFTDVAPGAKEWASLNAENSKTFIALGVEIANGNGWNAGYNESARYAADAGDTLFGSLDADATGNMSLKANYGLAFDQNYTAVHNLVFLFNLA